MGPWKLYVIQFRCSHTVNDLQVHFCLLRLTQTSTVHINNLVLFSDSLCERNILGIQILRYRMKILGIG